MFVMGGWPIAGMKSVLLAESLLRSLPCGMRDVQSPPPSPFFRQLPGRLSLNPAPQSLDVNVAPCQVTLAPLHVLGSSELHCPRPRPVQYFRPLEGLFVTAVQCLLECVGHTVPRKAYPPKLGSYFWFFYGLAPMLRAECSHPVGLRYRRFLSELGTSYKGITRRCYTGTQGPCAV